MRYEQWPAYVTVAEKKAKAQRQIKKLLKTTNGVKPVEIEGRTIASTFWGKAWCKHLEKFSDYSNRLPRGKSYVRHGAVCHLEIGEGEILAKVCGTSMYNVKIKITLLAKTKWKEIKSRCTGKIGSLIELLQGKISKDVMAVVTDSKTGLLPLSGQIKLECSCPDWAVMCKHVAAVLYGIGNRLDYEPELLFVLRGVDASELIDEGLTLSATAKGTSDVSSIADDQLQGLFGDDIELELEGGESQVAEAEAVYEESGEGGSGELWLSGAEVAAKRAEMGLSVVEFAKQVGVTPATVYRWEKMKQAFKMKAKYGRVIATT
ncbi:MAG: helix-turn-helix domain-containing protein [Kiritimatiellae bacterium]|nr:helix-turn-helix domain-containing protein [Kiritimatiellia bacterium]